MNEDASEGVIEALVPTAAPVAEGAFSLDISAAQALVGDDIEALSAQLRVSVHALRLRMSELGL